MKNQPINPKGKAERCHTEREKETGRKRSDAARIVKRGALHDPFRREKPEEKVLKDLIAKSGENTTG